MGLGACIFAKAGGVGGGWGGAGLFQMTVLTFYTFAHVVPTTKPKLLIG